MDADSTEPKLLTQTDVLRFIADQYRASKEDPGGPQSNIPLERLLESSARDLSIATGMAATGNLPGTPVPALVTVDESDNLIQALDMMLDNDLNAVAVVHPVTQRLLGTLSLSDLRGTVAERLIWMSTTTVAAFIQRHHPKMQWWHHPSLSWMDVPTPLTCTLDMRLIDIIHGILHGKVHRLWVADDTLRPTGVVTTSDVIFVLVKAHHRLETAPKHTHTD